MMIDGRLPEGYVIVCGSHRESHSFLVKQLGPSVECPKCGTTAISALLATEFAVNLAHHRPAGVAKATAWNTTAERVIVAASR